MSTVTPMRIRWEHGHQSKIRTCPSILSWASAADEDIVAAFADHFVEAAAAARIVVATTSSAENGLIVAAARPSCVPSSIQSSPSLPASAQIGLGHVDEVVAARRRRGARCRPRWR